MKELRDFSTLSNGEKFQINRNSGPIYIKISSTSYKEDGTETIIKLKNRFHVGEVYTN